MKKTLLFLIVVLSYSGIYSQNDSIYFWKEGQLIAQRSIKTADLDSITFKRPNLSPAEITICNQIWSTRNIDVTSYSDGTPIPQVTDQTQWAGLTTGAWCYYNNDPASEAIYGKLYNWYAVAGIYDAASAANPALRKKIAPTGWHVPTDAEWTILTDCLGGESVAGGKMKATGTIQEATGFWESPNTDATNSSGFNGLPGGLRKKIDSNTFLFVPYSGNWWSSTEFSITSVWYRKLDFNTGFSIADKHVKTSGCSVRCIKD